MNTAIATIEWTVQLRFLVALALGFLVGLERESAKIEQKHLVFGGVRTHPLISLFGFGCAWLYQIGATFLLPAGLLCVGALTSIAYVAKIRGERYGTTSEISALLTFVTGALALLVDIWAAMALGVINTFLLSEKARLETYVERLSKVEFLATLKFLIVTVIVLPVLPDQEYTRFRLNPTRIWQIVVLVSTIGFVGYFLSKKFGAKVGLWLSGLMGGIVSSTAVTIAAGRLAQKEEGRAANALQAALLAASVMYLRLLAIIGFINAAFIPLLWWRLGILALVGVGMAVTVKGRERNAMDTTSPNFQNPFEITPALWFAVVFVVVLVLTNLVKEFFGTAGTLVLAVIVGVADVDPFILSLIQSPGAATSMVAGGVILAVMSNTVAKGFYFGWYAPAVRKETAWRYGLWALLHIPLVLGVLS